MIKSGMQRENLPKGRCGGLNMLQDLQELLAEVRDRIRNFPAATPFTPSNELWQIVSDTYGRTTGDAVQVSANALVIETRDGKFISISAQELPRVWAVIPYAIAIREYEEALGNLATEMGFASPTSSDAAHIFSALPPAARRRALAVEDRERIEEKIAGPLGLAPDEQTYFTNFLFDKEWSGVGKALDRNDWVTFSVVSAGGWVVAAADRRGDIAIALSHSLEFDRLMRIEMDAALGRAVQPAAVARPVAIAGRNRIIYGAPGTGKSHKVDEEIAGKISIRTVFHPDTQNSDFFGSLKPTMTDQGVAYGFAPGPMARALLDAHNDPEHHHFLVIEELNRAPAAAVFGELFQLLDRKPDGSSTYTIDFPTQESAIWFRDHGYTSAKLSLPANLTIIATMNSADQGVHPLDTAFRRRWEQEYMPLAKGDGPQGNICFIDRSRRQKEILWKEFVAILNKHLIDTLRVAEDRLLGLWFVKEEELNNEIPDKILLYLLDDLLRHEGREQVFAEGISGYGHVASLMSDGERILSRLLLEKLEAALPAEAAAEAPVEVDEQVPQDAG